MNSKTYRGRLISTGTPPYPESMINAIAKHNGITREEFTKQAMEAYMEKKS